MLIEVWIVEVWDIFGWFLGVCLGVIDLWVNRGGDGGYGIGGNNWVVFGSFYNDVVVFSGVGGIININGNFVNLFVSFFNVSSVGSFVFFIFNFVVNCFFILEFLVMEVDGKGRIVFSLCIIIVD